MSSDTHDTNTVLMNVEALRKNFTFEGETIPVLQGLDLTIYRGDMCSIVGQSGVGKSTLMHILGALDRPSSGRVLFTGEDVFSRPDAELAQFRNRSMGFVFQFHHQQLRRLAQQHVTQMLLLHHQQGQQYDLEHSHPK